MSTQKITLNGLILTASAAICLLTLVLSVLKTVGVPLPYLRSLEYAIGGDKVLHLVFAFSVMLAVSATLAICLKKSRYRIQPYIIAGGLVMVLCLLDECLQAFSPQRQFDLNDFLMSGAGALLAWLLFQVGLKIYQEEELSDD